MKESGGLRDTSIPVFSIDPGPYGESRGASLLDYWDLIVSRKAFLALTAAVFVALGLIRVFMTPWAYEARVYVLPPGQQAMPEIILPSLTGQLETHRADPLVVFRAFLGHLESRSLRREYFDSAELLAHFVSGNVESNTAQSIFERTFNRNLGVVRSVDRPRQGGPASVSMIAADPELAARWSNEFVRFADRATVDGHIEGLRQTIETRVRALQEEIEGRRNVAARRRVDRVAVLGEAAGIARRLGIRNPSPLLVPGSSPVYMGGTRALEEEIQALSRRESDDPFVPGLRELEERISRLRSVDLAAIPMQAMRIDQAAFNSSFRVRPRILRIMSLALVAGLLLGVGAVIGWDAIQRQRSRDL